MMIVVLYVVLNDYGGIEIVCDSLKKNNSWYILYCYILMRKKNKNRSFVDVFV